MKELWIPCQIKIGRVFGSISETGQFLENRELDPEMIEIHYNTDLWKLCEDGYWYYKDVLPAGKNHEKASDGQLLSL